MTVDSLQGEVRRLQQLYANELGSHNATKFRTELVEQESKKDRKARQEAEENVTQAAKEIRELKMKLLDEQDKTKKFREISQQLEQETAKRLHAESLLKSYKFAPTRDAAVGTTETTVTADNRPKGQGQQSLTEVLDCEKLDRLPGGEQSRSEEVDVVDLHTPSDISD